MHTASHECFIDDRCKSNRCKSGKNVISLDIVADNEVLAAFVFTTYLTYVPSQDETFATLGLRPAIRYSKPRGAS